MGKINIAELLRDCPKGMELDCALFEGLEFDSIVDNEFLPIRCRIKNSKGGYNVHNFTEYGQWNSLPYAKCVIFPKNKTTWDGFVPPCQFKDGDIISNGTFIAIFHKTGRPDTSFIRDILYYRCWYNCRYNTFKAKIDFGIGSIDNYRLATEEEKQKLFDAIKDNGYKWNEVTKTLEKLVEPKFKVGDRIKNGKDIATIVRIYEDFYDVKLDSGIGSFTINLQDEWELAPNKFDIATLKPFESRVLVRDYDNRIWIPTFWGKRLEDDSNCGYLTTNGCYKYLIPYEGNEHLLGTTADCDDFYKTWKK